VKKLSVKKQLWLSVFALSFVSTTLAPLSSQSSTPVKPLTIEAIFAPGGLGGRGPETLEWSPDGSKLTFVERTGEQGELWYVDATTGEKKVLVSAAKLAALAPDYSKGRARKRTPDPLSRSRLLMGSGCKAPHLRFSRPALAL
jgi:hypothetical protein